VALSTTPCTPVNITSSTCSPAGRNVPPSAALVAFGWEFQDKRGITVSVLASSPSVFRPLRSLPLIRSGTILRLDPQPNQPAPLNDPFTFVGACLPSDPGIPDALLFGLASVSVTRQFRAPPAPMLSPLGEQTASLPLRAAAAQRPTTFSKCCFEGWVVCEAAQLPRSVGPHPPPQANLQRFEDLLWTPLSAPELYLNRLLRRFAEQNDSDRAKPLPVKVCAIFEVLLYRYRRELRKPAPLEDFFLSL
jgi:hypothetical protein